jgi:hypothetical protein
MAGLTDTGFTRKTLSEILASIKQNAQNEFGTDFNTGDDSVFLQLAGPFSVEADELWQGSEAAHSAYTKNGAEGLHLDNLFTFFGITRLDSAASAGTLFISTDTTLVDPTTLVGTTITSSLAEKFSQTNASDTIGKDNTFGYTVLTTDLALSTAYQLDITDDNGSPQSTTLTVTDESSKQTWLADAKTFIELHRADTIGKIFLDSTGIYVGHSSATVFDPTPTSVVMFFTPAVGTRFGKVNITGLERKTTNILENDVYTITPSFTGLVEAKGLTGFTTGRNVETDAEYRARAARLQNVQEQSSAASIANAVLTSGATDVVIHENPTDTPTTEVAQAFAYHVIVVGGTDSLIADAILQNAPLNVLSFGAISTVVNNELGTPVTIKHTRATDVDLDIRLDYDTLDDSLLTTAEQNSIRDSIGAYVDAFSIGEDLFVFRVSSLAGSALDADRLISLVVNVRVVGGPTYQQTDFIAAFDDILLLDKTTILFNKV